MIRGYILIGGRDVLIGGRDVLMGGDVLIGRDVLKWGDVLIGGRDVLIGGRDVLMIDGGCLPTSCCGCGCIHVERSLARY